ncbi:MULTISPECIES: flagellar hook-associated protein FlgK [Enterobacterales]|uniref:Flagellar hook-associated protein 1 n=1 Tax=Candidatus Pantoea symbiotica TaxID=1884370 RepID=A0A1I3R7S9_9GAMM|nr:MULTISPECIES: flagellar hook-associated protein FlgK [Enterobacterales]MRS21622.1 flagellar hook-associated protein FlgK [Enterobacteriaceae bacterium RIT692]MRT22858.1 flagellar hook-associated protein FlgK [Enterobacteriaceae bacterium RIT697]MRT40024.1 flagellar hook-associated protein FlgK [Enterobacteriaceae bacterium RIT702]KAJ9433490.1 flagellar hook-associated protein FlgK [Pantoea sp. YR343]MBB3304963.1 flagellar hook-associated protein 1 FlgK [Enterobacter sp. Sphag1F]
MSSIINSAMSGLSAAQAALSTTSNNISNYTVAGYSRQTAILSQSNSTLQGNSYYGNGVTLSGVQREYDEFITAQLRGSSANYSAVNTQYNQISNIDDLLSTSTTSLSTSIQSFFTNVQNVVSNANDPSARQSMLSYAQGLVNQFQTTAQYLNNMQNSVNTDIASNVDQINTFTSQIADLNSQIAKLTTGGGAAPNNLLDQRDQLVNSLNNVVGVNVSQQDGSYIVSMGSVTLVNGKNSTSLVAMPSSSDSTRTTVGYVDKQAGNVEIPEKTLTTGSLGGLLAFRTQDLDTAQNQLGQLAAAFTTSFNTVHSEGYDSNGDQGGNFFNIGSPTVVGNSKNTSAATVTAAWSDTSAMKASNYTVSYDGSNWSVTRMSDNVKFSVTPDATDGTLNFDGLKLTVSTSPAPNAKDSFLVKPVQNVIAGMSVAITDESQIAAASSATSGESDNRNAQKLLDLQDSKLVNGNATIAQAYASIVSSVGNKTSTLETASTTQENVVTQLSDRQQSVSGVNLDEEYSNLTKYQQFYMANAQVLQTASTIFNALMGIRG